MAPPLYSTAPNTLLDTAAGEEEEEGWDGGVVNGA